MANITITIPDDKLDYAKTALGNGTLLTNAQAKAALVSIVKEHIRSYYERAAFAQAQASVDSAVATQQTATQAAATNADAIAIT